MNKTILSLALSAVFNVGFASPIELSGTVEKNISLYTKNTHSKTQLQASNSIRSIKFLNFKLTPAGQKDLSNRIINAHHKFTRQSIQAFSSQIPSRIELGMNEVPVLDQGSHGSCATFAVTAALDAAMNKGDFISQVCSLRLGQYLEENTYYPSGWDGSAGSSILTIIDMYGFVSKNAQTQYGCGGVTAYPTYDNIPPNSMSVEAYHKLSQHINNYNVSFSTLLSLDDVYYNVDGVTQTLNRVKNALAQGDRVTLAFFIPNVDEGVAGATGTHQVKNDTWVLSSNIVGQSIFEMSDLAGHEIIITGYDDNAISTDAKGKTHKGLLKLRNSWTKYAGDKGDFYMTYEYFTALAGEAQRIRSAD